MSDTNRLLWAIFIVLSILTASVITGAGRCRAAETMIASYYGTESGNRTANGERFNPHGLTAAHRTLPFGTRLRVCYREACTVVRINDRGPAKWTGRTIDLSKGAARAIGMTHVGIARVTVERIP